MLISTSPGVQDDLAPLTVALILLALPPKGLDDNLHYRCIFNVGSRERTQVLLLVRQVYYQPRPVPSPASQPFETSFNLYNRSMSNVESSSLQIRKLRLRTDIPNQPL